MSRTADRILGVSMRAGATGAGAGRLLGACFVATLVLAACERDDAAEIEARPLTGEAAQATPPVEAVAELRRGADPGITIYDPPPDLSRPETGVIYVPGAPPALAPEDTAAGMESRTSRAVRAAGAIPPEDTLARPRGTPQDTLRTPPRAPRDTLRREE